MNPYKIIQNTDSQFTQLTSLNTRHKQHTINTQRYSELCVESKRRQESQAQVEQRDATKWQCDRARLEAALYIGQVAKWPRWRS